MPTSEAPWRRRFRTPRMSLPGWARDQPSRLLYTSNRSGVWELYSWDRRMDVHRQVTDRPEGTFHGALDPAGEHIWWFDDDQGNEYGQWVIEPFGGGTRQPAAPDIPPAYSMGLAIGRQVTVLGTATDSQVALYLVRPDTPSLCLYSHHEAAWVRALSADDTLLALGHSEHGDSRHPAVRILDTQGQGLAELWDGPGYGLWATAWSPLPGDPRLLVQHQRRDLLAPLIWNIATGDISDIPVELPGDVEASWYPDAQALLLRHSYRGRTELYRFDLRQRRLDYLPTAAGTIPAALVRPDGEVWYTWSHSAVPMQLRTDTQILFPLQEVEGIHGVAYSDHLVDGIHLFLAEPQRPRPHPTIFVLHGGPALHDTDTFSPRVQAWVEHGFAVALVNYRGSSGYGKTWRDALEGNPGFTELADIARVHDWVVHTGIADPQRIILSGQSWGGYLTLLGLGCQPERWALGIAGVPVADYIAAYEDEMEPLKALDRALFKGSPSTIPQAYAARSPLTYVQHLRVPVLILAGENDPRCPIRQIDNYLARLRELEKAHEVYRYDAGHGSFVMDEIVQQIAHEIAFAARHFGMALLR